LQGSAQKESDYRPAEIWAICIRLAATLRPQADAPLSHTFEHLLTGGVLVVTAKSSTHRVGHQSPSSITASGDSDRLRRIQAVDGCEVNVIRKPLLPK